MVLINKSNTLNILLIRGLKIGQSILTFFVMSKLFELYEFGYYAYAYSIALSLIVLSYFGSEQFGLKLLAKKPVFIGRLLLLKTIFSFVLSGFYFFFINNIVEGLETLFVFSMCLYIMCNYELLIFTYYNVVGKLDLLLINLLTSFLITTAIKFYSLIYFDKTFLYLAMFFDGAIPLFIFYIYLVKNNHLLIFRLRVKSFLSFFRTYYKVFIPLFIATLLVQLNIRIDSFFVSTYLGGEELSNYSIALKFNELFAILVSSTIAVYSPVFFRCKCVEALTSVISKIVKLITIIYFISSIFIFLFYVEIDFYFFDSKYSEATEIILVLFLSTFFGGISSLVSLWYIYHGEEVSKARRVFLALILNLLLSLYLIPIMGVVGAALVNLIVSVSLAIIFNVNRKDLREVFKNVLFKRSI